MVTWFAPVHVSRGYPVCAMDSDRRKELARLRQRRHTYHISVPRSCENECCGIPRVELQRCSVNVPSNYDYDDYILTNK